MGRRVNKVKTTERKSNWIFQINVELNYNDKPKIAFLSGLERSYFPEDPGVSKFGVVYQINLEDDVPPCTYSPPEDKIQKPISHRGYGIGGLCAPRFEPRSKHLNYPSPDQYQPEVVEAIIPQLPELDSSRKSKLASAKRRKEALALKKGRQCYIGFGTLLTQPRFGNPPSFNTAGVGAYNVTKLDAPRLKINSSFGRSPIRSQQSTEIRCIWGADEKCIECNKILYISDHYRTRFTVNVPLPETRSPNELGTDFPRGRTFVNLCNVCFYRATQGHSKNWPQKKVRWLFKKVRTCSSIHEHQGMPEIIHRANCKTVRRLQRKEAIMSKHYPDRVEESLPAKTY